MTNWLADYPNNIWDVLSISLLLGAITENVPSITAFVTLFWVLIRIGETCTFRTAWRKVLRRKGQSREDCIMKMGDQ